MSGGCTKKYGGLERQSDSAVGRWPIAPLDKLAASVRYTDGLLPAVMTSEEALEYVNVRTEVTRRA